MLNGSLIVNRTRSHSPVSYLSRKIVSPYAASMIGASTTGLCCMFFLCCAVGCGSLRPLPPADLSEPGWTVRQGQAIWETDESDLAGEIIFAARPGRSASLQFIKTPLPLVSAQISGSRWTIHFAAEDRTHSGRGTPPSQLLWLHVANALQGVSPPPPVGFNCDASGNWELVNAKTGESISGFLTP